MATIYPIHHGITLASGSEIENVVIETLANDPAPLVTGRVWYNSTTGFLKVALGNPAVAADVASGANVAAAVSTLRTDLQGKIDALDADTYSQAETDSAINLAVSSLIDGAPGILDTLSELANAIGDDADFVTTIQTQIAEEANLARAGEGSLVFEHVTASDLTSAINAEGTRAKAAESTNTNAINTEASTRATATGNLASLTTGATGSLVDAINEVNDDVTSAINEIDATQVGAGLDTTGSYVPDSASNYIGSATSLANADAALDAQARTTADALATEVADRGNAITEEATARGNADSALQDLIDGNTADISSNDTDITANANANAASNVRILALENDGTVAALQSEVDATQSSAGLNADGSYSATATASFTATATSLKSADILLDSAVLANQTAITTERDRSIAAEAGLQGQISDTVNLTSSAQTELNAVEVGAGLGVNGGYTASVTSNFAAAATSLKNADELLDSQIKSNLTAITTEASDRTTADNTLQDNINAVVSTAGTNAGAITTETTRAKGEESRIEGKVNANTGDIEGNVTAISNEATTRENADTTLQGNIDAANDATDTVATNLGTETTRAKGEEARIEGKVNTNVNDISEEKTRATGAESDLNTAISDETTRASNAEAKNTTDLGTETTRATTAEGTLTQNLSSEQTTRGNADTLLQTNIDAANDATDTVATNLGTETTRASGEEARIEVKVNANTQATSTVATDLGTETARAKAAEAVNTGNFTTEVSNRTTADADLQDKIDTANGKITLSEGAITSETSRATLEEARIEGKVNANADAIVVNAGDITDEAGRAQNAEIGLGTDITTEANSRSTEDARLAGLIADNESLTESVDAAIRGAYNATIYTHASAAASLVHAIPHNLNSNFVEVSVFMFSGGKWQNDIALIEEVDANNITITMTDSRDVKVVVRSAISM